jgi:hypothetical protein
MRLSWPWLMTVGVAIDFVFAANSRPKLSRDVRLLLEKGASAPSFSSLVCGFPCLDIERLWTIKAQRQQAYGS